ncbi:3284_t:CDS:1, partial [Gigaspora margarita]
FKYRNEPKSDKVRTISKKDLNMIKNGILKFNSEDNARKTFCEAIRSFVTLVTC